MIFRTRFKHFQIAAGFVLSLTCLQFLHYLHSKMLEIPLVQDLKAMTTSLLKFKIQEVLTVC